MSNSKNRYIFPVVVMAGIIGVMALLANTDFAQPLVEYIHTNSITPVGAIICFVATAIAFYGVFRLLVKLGESFLPEDDEQED